MIVACVDHLSYIENKDKHTVAYSENGKRVSFSWRDNKNGTFRHVVADTEDEARIKISKQLCEYLKNQGLNPNDFGFGIKKAEVEPDGSFWWPSCTHCCEDFIVGFRKEPYG